MFKKLSLLLATVLIASLFLAACQPAAEQPPATAGKVCQVTDTGGIDDQSFNMTAWKGAQRAQSELNFEAKYLESQQQTDYERNINAFIEEDCSLIVTVGFLLGDATSAAATANPDQKFAIVDFAYDPTLDNVLGLVFDTDQAAFLAGYMAAGMTQTGKVGTFGGLQIPPVTIFMDGFYWGVQYYNQQKGTNVEVLGWDPAAQTGLFTGNFESTDDGRTLGQTLLGEGADIIMPVAGPVGLGTAEAVKSAGNAWIVGVDTDWTISAAQYADVVLTSVNKNMDVAVFTAAQSVANNNFAGGVYLGTLENGGVGLGTVAGVVPAELRAEVEELQKSIISGAVTVGQ
jgi:basic membrane protein A and related proteins